MLATIHDEKIKAKGRFL